MEFTINQRVLRDELDFVQGVVEKKSTIPVLASVLIETVGKDGVRITGTDLDVTLRCAASATVKEEGAICIQAKRLFDVVRLLSDGDVHFVKEDNDWVRMRSGKSKYRLAGVSREQFPEVPNFVDGTLKLSAEALTRFIHATSFAISSKASRLTLSGAKFMLGGGSAKMVTTDGHRLALIGTDGLAMNGTDGTLDALIPQKALTALVKMCRNADGSVTFGEDPNHLYFDVNGRQLSARRLSGTFPNYEMILPKETDRMVTVDVAEFLVAAKRVIPMANENTRSLTLTITEEAIEVSAASSDAAGEAAGEAAGSLGIEVVKGDGETVLALNGNYLIEYLSSVGSGQVAMGFSDNTPVTFEKVGDDGYSGVHLIMPVRML